MYILKGTFYMSVFLQVLGSIAAYFKKKKSSDGKY